MDTNEKIRLLREFREITQEELSIRIGCSQTLVSFWERGITTPSLQSIVEIAEAMEFDPFYLLPDWFIEEVNKHATP